MAIAKAQVLLAEVEAERLKDGVNPDELGAAELKVSKAENDLAQAQSNLESATLVAPFGGTVMEVRAEVGDSVSGAFITLADLSLATLDTYFDETDLDKVIAGSEIEGSNDHRPGPVGLDTHPKRLGGGQGDSKKLPCLSAQHPRTLVDPCYGRDVDRHREIHCLTRPHIERHKKS